METLKQKKYGRPSGALTCLYRHGIDVTIDSENHRSVETDKGKEIGECAYQASENGWNIYHTGVSPDYQGKGLAKRLVYRVLEEAERGCVNVTTTCSYARRILGE